ncbi:sodium- and chloride-dependent glycine transporter 2-like [Eriocheir sinensis]|uniref:sodium- and chloride-dependent glycine transporter 2-like n=1 Tax=Eriocheir sinensis TaxID=95602 RepID=UPI0021C8A3DD|nr:sodium- and chloride-dependent glycine transporter 2-like [Eriocheir sinensis]
MVETVTTAIFDQFESLRTRKPLVVGLVCLLLFVSGLTMCLQGGVYMFELFFFFSSSVSVIILAIVEIVAIQYVYGFKKFYRHITEDMGIGIPRPLQAYWTVTWLVVTPLALLIILVFSFIYFVPAYWGDYEFPSGIQVLGWLLVFSSVILIPLGMIYATVAGSGCTRALLASSPDFCPAHIRKQGAGGGQVNLAFEVADAPHLVHHF